MMSDIICVHSFLRALVTIFCLSYYRSSFIGKSNNALVLQK
jgi:hypothetical protein